jgi:hypothetical protein
VGDEEHPVIVADHAFVSPQATLLGCEVEAAAYVATGATVLHGARVETGAVVAVGALVHGGTVLSNGFFLEPGMIAIGDPVATYAPGDPSLAERSGGWASPGAPSAFRLRGRTGSPATARSPMFARRSSPLTLATKRCSGRTPPATQS